MTWWPAVESYSKDGNLHVRIALPGVDPKDVEVTVADDYLTVRGERKSKTDEKNGGRFVREFAYGSFERTFSLPEGIDPGKVIVQIDGFRAPITAVVVPVTAHGPPAGKIGSGALGYVVVAQS